MEFTPPATQAPYSPLGAVCPSGEVHPMQGTVDVPTVTVLISVPLPHPKVSRSHHVSRGLWLVLWPGPSFRFDTQDYSESPPSWSEKASSSNNGRDLRNRFLPEARCSCNLGSSSVFFPEISSDKSLHGIQKVLPDSSSTCTRLHEQSTTFHLPRSFVATKSPI